MNQVPVQQVDQTGWEQNYKFLHMLTRRAMTRVSRHRLHLEYDDLFQEASIAYMTARRSFNSALGFKFITYLGSVVERRLWAIVNRTIEVQIAMPRRDFLDDQAMMDAIDQAIDPTPGVDQQLEMQQAAVVILSKLSPEALIIFHLIQDPPIEVKREYTAWQMKGKIKNNKGRAPKTRVPVSFVCRILVPRIYGVSEGHGRRIEMEINYVLQYARDL